jgi:hypothetical protein
MLILDFFLQIISQKCDNIKNIMYLCSRYDTQNWNTGQYDCQQPHTF